MMVALKEERNTHGMILPHDLAAADLIPGGRLHDVLTGSPHNAALALHTIEGIAPELFGSAKETMDAAAMRNRLPDLEVQTSIYAGSPLSLGTSVERPTTNDSASTLKTENVLTTECLNSMHESLQRVLAALKGSSMSELNLGNILREVQTAVERFVEIAENKIAACDKITPAHLKVVTQLGASAMDLLEPVTYHPAVGGKFKSLEIFIGRQLQRLSGLLQQPRINLASMPQAA